MALPLLRRRLPLRPAQVLAGSALAPACAAVLWPKGRARVALVCALQMYVYVAAYKMPNDDQEALARRVHVDYPIRADRLIGLGELPTVRLQRGLHRDGHFNACEKVLVWAHWIWFATPHATLAYLYARDRERFTRAAVLTYAVFDLGVISYWLAPTAPPWYAAELGRGSSQPIVRRLMVEYGESFWRNGWAPLYSVLGGNPLAAMPSLHCATSAMSALLLAESGPLAGAVGTTYAGVLGFALVYLGEHYAVDLLGGLALTLAVRRLERVARDPVRAVGRAIARVGSLRERARGRPVSDWPPPPRVVDQTQIGSLPAGESGMPRVIFTRRRTLGLVLFVASVLAFLYLVLPKLAGLGRTWDRLDQGSPGWLALAAAFEMLSFAGYVALFRTVFVRAPQRNIDWRASYEITMAGLAATRLFAAAGSGGVALTVWALRRAGLERRQVAAQMVVFLTLLYGVYMAALVIFGVGLRTGLLPGGGGFAITILPAIFGGVLITLFLAFTLVPLDLEGRLAGWAERRGGSQRRLPRLLVRAGTLPPLVASGVRGAVAVGRSRDPLALGAVAWWGFDIATLWASFEAFGSSPELAVIVMAYFVGMLANVLPLPGGIGGVDGGMIGAFIAFGVAAPIAVVAVLVYRALAFWLPTIPGAVAYWQLRRRVAGWSAETPQLEPLGTTA